MAIALDFMEFHDALLQDAYTKALVNSLQQNLIPNNQHLRDKLLGEADCSLTNVIGGYLKTIKRLTSSSYWRTMKKDVKLYLQ